MRTTAIISALAIALLMWQRPAAGQNSTGGATQQAAATETQTTMNPIGSNMGSVYGPTADSGYLIGKAAFAMGLGQYNYNSALAVRHLEDAFTQGLNNNLLAEKVYFEKKRINEEWWASKHPAMTPEQNLLVEQVRVPRRLTASELDPTWGVIRWPLVLERPEFDSVRQALDDAFAHRTDGNFGIGSPEYNRVKTLTKEMRSILDRDYDTMSQMEWIQAMRFIESLAYEPRFAPGTAVGMNLK